MITRSASLQVTSKGSLPSAFGKAACRWLLPLDRAALCAEARRRTGLEEFGDPPVEPGLSVLLASLDEEANLHPLGRLLMRIHLRALLETRLRLEEAWRGQASALENARIERPIFIVGMPRSGSTFLHELMAEDPNHRAPRVWEVMFPLGASRRQVRNQAQRIRKTERCLWWFRRLAPRADAVYPMRARTPHEDVAIQSHTFLSEEFISSCRIPRYEAFLRSADLTPAYTWQRRFLQHLQLEDPGKRWVLKSPDHVYGLKALFAVFPDAVIIQTHRNPVEVLKSSADLTRVLRGLYGWPADPEEIQTRETKMLAEGTERFIEFRDSHPELAARFIDVKYTELVAEPVATVRSIYERLQSPWPESLAERLRNLVANRSRYRGRRASAEPADLRLGATPEADRFERYCSRFGLPSAGTGFRR